jgi:hypothetical protein
LRHIVNAPGAEDARGFRRRVRILAAIYAVLFCSCLGGILLIAWHGKLFVALAQRSNVETLTILFLLVFYAYLATLSAPGFVGAARIALWATRRNFARDRGAEIQLQHRKLGDPGEGPWAALNAVVESDDGQPLRFELRDEHGTHGVLVVEGARVSQIEAHAGGSADLIAYFVRQIAESTGRDIPIVAWGQLDDDEAERYLAQVEFARNLRRALGSAPLWPTVEISAAQRDEVARRLEQIRPALLEDALLPDWEYSAEHKLPVIPEPLGFVSLARSAKRADPVATMGFATLMVLLTVSVVILFVLHPPWVPG